MTMNPIATANQHAWVYAVLIEMNEYCRNEGLDGVSGALTQAIERMEPVIFPRAALGPAPVATAIKPRRISPFGKGRAVPGGAVVPFPLAR